MRGEIVLSAHNLFQIEAICDRVMILRRGKVVALGTMDGASRTIRVDHVSIWFSHPDPSRINPQSLNYRKDDRGFACDPRDMASLNVCSETIAASGGRVNG